MGGRWGLAAVSIALPDLAFAQGQVAPLAILRSSQFWFIILGNISTYWTKQDKVAGFTNHVSDMILSVVRTFGRAH